MDLISWVIIFYWMVIDPFIFFKPIGLLVQKNEKLKRNQWITLLTFSVSRYTVDQKNKIISLIEL